MKHHRLRQVEETDDELVLVLEGDPPDELWSKLFADVLDDNLAGRARLELVPRIHILKKAAADELGPRRPHGLGAERLNPARAERGRRLPAALRPRRRPKEALRWRRTSSAVARQDNALPVGKEKPR
jgi:hypothetical protein